MTLPTFTFRSAHTPFRWNALLASILRIHPTVTLALSPRRVPLPSYSFHSSSSSSQLHRRSKHTQHAQEPSAATVLATSDPSLPEPSSSSSPRLRIHASGLKRNHTSWTPEADALLVSLRSQGKTWAQIGDLLRKSRQACNRRFDSVLAPSTSFWDERGEPLDRNALLCELVSQRLSWKEIGTRLNTKASACERQWRILERERVASTSATTSTATVAGETLSGQGHAQPSQASESKLEQPHHRAFKGRQFRTADVQLLKTAIAAIDPRDRSMNEQLWITLSKDVFHSKFTPAQLRYYYARLQRQRLAWSELQDKTLFETMTDRSKSWHQTVPAPPSPWNALLSNEKTLEDDKQWEIIAQLVPGEHTGAECRERWIKMKLGTVGLRRFVTPVSQDRGRQGMAMTSTTTTTTMIAGMEMDFEAQPLMKQSRVCWSQEQIERLTSILQRMRGDSEETLIQWDVVAIEMRGEFSKQQCKSRWNRMQRQGEGAVKSTGRWSEGEIDNLIRGVADLGDRWTEIHRQWLPGRTPTFIQAKWTALASKLRREMVIRRWTWKQACLETFGKEIDVRLGKLPSNWVDPHDIASRPKRIDKAI